MVNTRLKLGQYEAWVVVEGEEVEHYAIEVDEAKRVTCWIASTAGKHFGISLKKNQTDFECGAFIYLDGPYARGRRLRKNSTRIEWIDSVRQGSTTLPFIFGTIDLTDDESNSNEIVSCENLGEIKIIFRHVDYKTSKTGRKGPSPPVPAVGRIHERAKKSLTHQIKFGEAREGKDSRRTRYDKIVKEELATFIIRYRSLEMLKAMDIAPRDPTPERDPVASSQASSHLVLGPSSSSLGKRKVSEVKVEDENDDEDPSDGVANKILQLEMELAQLKESVARNRPKKKIKQETQLTFLPGEVIDLTL